MYLHPSFTMYSLVFIFADDIKSTFHIYGTFTNINFIFVHLKVSSHLKIYILKMSFNAMLTSQQFHKNTSFLSFLGRERRQEAIFCSTSYIFIVCHSYMLVYKLFHNKHILTAKQIASV